MINLTQVVAGIATAIINRISLQSALPKSMKGTLSEDQRQALEDAAKMVAKYRIVALAGTEHLSPKLMQAYHATLDNLEVILGATARKSLLAAADEHFQKALG